jgi:RHS repeat-associated protein
MLMPMSLAHADDSTPPAPPTAPTSVQQGQASLGSADTSIAATNALATARVQPSTGFLEASIPFQLPAARGAVQPSLALTYNSSAGVGVGGEGWSLSLPSIERHNPSGAPLFNDPPSGQSATSAQDRFTYAGSPLVLVCGIQAGGFCRNADQTGETFPTFASAGGWTYYRLATEDGSLLRFFWSADHSQWYVQGKGGDTSVYGAPAAGSTDLSGIDHDSHSYNYRWNVVRRYDAQRNSGGTPTNLIEYVWTHPANTGAVGYLTDVYDTPHPTDTAPAPASFAHHTHLVYGASLHRPVDTPVWLATPTQALTRVDVTSQDLAATGQRQQVRRYHLVYQDYGWGWPVSSVTLEGNCTSGNNYESPTTQLLPAPGAGASCPQRPPTTFTYNLQTFSPSVYALPSLPKLPTLVDVNNDGLPDLLSSVPNGATALIINNSTTTAKAFTAAVSSIPGTIGGQPIATLFGSGSAAYAAGSLQMDGRLDTMVTNVGAVPNLITTFPPTPPSAPPANALAPITYTFMNPSQAGPGGAWTWATGATGTFLLDKVWPEFITVDERFLGDEQPYATMDVDGDGIADLLTTVVWGYSNDSTSSPNAADFLHRRLSVRFSQRSTNGTYSPFAGSVASAPSGRTDTCMGGSLFGGDNVLDNGLDKNQHPIQAWRTFGDLNGDGLPDFVQLDYDTANNASITYWPGHGDGNFGVCPTGVALECACSDTESVGRVMLLAQGEDNLHLAAVHDVNGDGYGDLIVPTATGFDLLLGSGDGLSFDSPLQVPVHTDLGWSGSGLQDQFLFADMDGNGIDDVIVSQGGTGVLGIVDMWQQRPAQLIGISNGVVTTAIHYDSTSNLSRAAAATDAWLTQTPQVVHVVTSIETSDPIGDSYTTSYAYQNPVYDGHDQAFLGFQRVTETTPGTAATLMNTATTFYYGGCGVDFPGVTCPVGVDYAPASYRGLPILTDVFDGSSIQAGDFKSGIYLSTTHHSYSAVPLYLGADGRTVRRVYDAQDDTFLYDTSNYTPSTTVVQVPDISSPDMTVAPGILVRAASAHLQKTTTLDSFGNVQTVTDNGVVTPYVTPLVTVPVDTPIVKTTLSAVSSGTDPNNQWIWRAQSTSYGGTAAGTARSYSFTYDEYGNQLTVATTLAGTQPLARAAGGAGSPSGASQNAPAVLRKTTYDPAGTGNPMTVDAYPSSSSLNFNGRCTEYAYDPAYSQLRTTVSVDVGDCGSATKLVTQSNIDRVLGVTLLTIAPGSEQTTMTYDGFGRLLTVAKPDPVTGMSDSATTTISYADTSYGQLVHTYNSPISANNASSSGYAATDTYVYQDGFGRTIQQVSTGDAFGQWVLSGQVTRDARGRTTQSFVPSFITVSDGSSVPFTPPAVASTSAVYDAFNRTTQASDIDGTILSQNVYHALSVESRDGEQVNRSGPHGNASETTTVDGHGRATTIVNYGNGGQVTTQATYQPTGEVTSISRTGAVAAGPVSYVRYMSYDSLGRLVINAEPNASHNYAPPGSKDIGVGGQQVWTYAYDDLGDLVGTSDPRACGENIAYDGAGRVQSEDYSPCSATEQAPYSAPLADGDGTEAYYVYEGGTLATGLLSDVYDRASHVHLTHDYRGRVKEVDRKIARAGVPATALASRYSPTVFTALMTYDDRDRIATQSTGANVSELLTTNATFGALYGPSVVAAEYSPRGALVGATGSYGNLVSSTVTEADGRPDSIAYADAAKTTVAYSYSNSRRLLTGVKISRAGSFPTATSTYTPPESGAAQPTQQTVLANDVTVLYDNVNNPTLTMDQRIDSEWPVGAKPVATSTYAYDDAYRVTSVTRTYNEGVDPYTPPLASQMPDTSLASMALTTNRVLKQSFTYDGLGNTTATADDASVFYDRSLGTITNGSQATGTGGPNQLLSATLSTTTGVGGSLQASYDYAGNLTQLEVTRNGSCSPGSCTQLYQYTWDEVGQLAAATRFDYEAAKCTGRVCPEISTWVPGASVTYAYDANGNRVLRSGTESDGTTTYSAEIFPSLRLNHAAYDLNAFTYTMDTTTEAVYLALGNNVYGRVVYAPELPAIHGPQHVFLEITDQLGSTSIVIDKDTSELVERTTHLAYGAIDSDYRPDRWSDFREDYKFTGKEEDVEVGLTYFGARYYSAEMGRWISADPLAIHGMGGDMNPYAYVRGRVTRAMDPNGLDGEDYSAAGGFDESTEIATEVDTLNNEEGFDQNIVFNDDYITANAPAATSPAAISPSWLTQNIGGAPATDPSADAGPISSWPEVGEILAGTAVGFQMSSNPLSSAVAGYGGGLIGGASGYGVGVGLMGGGLMQIGLGLGGGAGAALATAGSFGLAVPVTAPATVVSAAAIANGVWAISVGAMVMMQTAAKGGGTGSYTNQHESGKTYSGKGDRARSQASGERVAGENDDPHVATDWTEADGPREAFKQESRRIDANGGVDSPFNYNKIESPGRRYRIEDGELPGVP